jgi:hypothetical protein
VLGAQSQLTGVVCNELERRIAGIVWPKVVSVGRPSSPANSPPETACLASSQAIEFFSGGEVYIDADFCRFLRFPAAILLTKFSGRFILFELRQYINRDARRVITEFTSSKRRTAGTRAILYAKPYLNLLTCLP